MSYVKSCLIQFAWGEGYSDQRRSKSSLPNTQKENASTRSASGLCSCLNYGFGGISTTMRGRYPIDLAADLYPVSYNTRL